MMISKGSIHSQARHFKPVPHYADLFTVEEFKEMWIRGIVNDYDGAGYPVKDAKESPVELCLAALDETLPADATHVAWYNK